MVGWVTLKTVMGAMLFPGMMDRILAHQAYDGQETAIPVDRDRRDNLEKPVAGLHATHGSFGAAARPKGLVISGRAARFSAMGLGAAGLLLAGAALGLASRHARR
jgi:hypothetical protein